jgi:anti-anti-sigma regulatory factor
MGRHFSCFYTPEGIQRGLPEHELEVAAKEGRFEDEGWRVTKNGKRFWASVVITSLREKDGRLRGFGKVTRDLTERKQTEERIRQQATEIMELSTPVMQVWQGVVVAPLIGSLDSQRTQQFMERLLNRIVETNSPMALVDIMGVPTIDTQTAQHLIETISAVRLLGAQVVLTGVRPAIAQTLVHLGIDLSNITTRSSLAAGLRVALDMLNLQVVAKNAGQ